MRKLIIILLSSIVLLSACFNNEAIVSLNELPDKYNLDDAKLDNSVVFEEGNITHGQSLWDDFITSTEVGHDATVRLAYYYTLDDSSRNSEELNDEYPVLFMKDLNFDGEKYILEGLEDGQLYSKEYNYLKKYEGEPNSAYATFSEYTYYVLVNDNSVTWDDIERGMFSSQSSDFIDHSRVYTKLVFE